MDGKGLQVIVARPVVMDLSAIGRSAEASSGSPTVTGRDLATISAEGEDAQAKLLELFGPLISQIRNVMSVGSIDFTQGFLQVAEQIPKLKWGDLSDSDPDSPIIDLSGLLMRSLGPSDEELGVCPIPIVEFSGDELELINNGTNSSGIQTLLREKSILQYFFPPPDQTALALVERGFGSAEQIIEAVATAPDIGHPFGETEIAPSGSSLTKILEVLEEKKLTVDAEVTGVALTDLGEEAQGTFRISTRESFITKLINRFEVKINLKSIFKVG